MIIVMNPNAPQASIDRVVSGDRADGRPPTCRAGKFRTVIGAVGEEGKLDQNHLPSLDGVEKVVPIMKPYKLASREFHEEDTVVEVGGGSTGRRRRCKIGGTHAACIAGPCAVENEEMLRKIARHVRDGGATILRGGVYKPRTSPYSFQGLGLQALKWMRETRRRAGHADLRRGDGHPAGRGHGAVRRHVPDRRPEHAELRPAPRGRQDAQAGAAEARPGRDGEGLAAVGGVRAEPGEQRRGPVRARDQDVRGQRSATRWTSAASRWRGSGATCR